MRKGHGDQFMQAERSQNIVFFIDFLSYCLFFCVQRKQDNISLTFKQ